MSDDDIIIEIRKNREAITRDANYDVDTLLALLRERATQHGRLLVTRPPRRSNSDGRAAE
jgi:hypothetical protein